MNSRLYHYAGILGALTVPALAVAAIEIPHVFSAGDPVSASEMNENFSSLADSIEALEETVAELQGDLEEARSAAGYVTLPDGRRVPYFRKIIRGIKNSTTETIAHGISGSPASQRRFIGCEYIANYEDGGLKQTANFNSASGTSTLLYCDMDNTNLRTAWANDNTREYQISLLYTAVPVE